MRHSGRKLIHEIYTDVNLFTLSETARNLPAEPLRSTPRDFGLRGDACH